MTIKEKQNQLSFKMGIHAEKLCFLEYLEKTYNDIQEKYNKSSGQEKAELRGKMHFYEILLDLVDYIK